MSEERLLKVLLEPHISEKTTFTSAGYPQYVFKVVKDTNKKEIKAAVEFLFGVSVKDVNICNVKGAVARKFGRAVGQMMSWKKAYVVLEPGQEINVA